MFMPESVRHLSKQNKKKKPVHFFGAVLDFHKINGKKKEQNFKTLFFSLIHSKGQSKVRLEASAEGGGKSNKTMRGKKYF